MDDEEKLTYLTNLVLIAGADSVLSPEEERYLEIARTAIGATKTHLRRARKEPSSTAIDLRPLRRFSARVRNLEDMIELALADGQLAEEEKKLLGRAGRAAGVTQEQLDRIVAEGKSRRTLAAGNCANCGASIATDAKFCPQCGATTAPTERASGTQLQITVPDHGITLAFAESSAAGFHEALELLKRVPSFHQALRGSKKWYAATFPLDSTVNVVAVAQKLKGMRNREVYVRGEQKEWDDVLGFVWCARGRNKSYRATEYCFGLEEGRLNIWGCKQLNMDWTQWADWFTYGRFVDKNTFEFDMRRIEHELRTRLRAVQFCPHLQSALALAALQYLPRRVSVSSQGDWEYAETYEPDPRAEKMTITRDYDGYREKETIQAVGVKPRTTSGALAIIKKAAKACGLKAPSLRPPST